MFHGALGNDPDFLRRLDVLRNRIAAAKIPPSVLDQSLNIATWNVREFGKEDRDPVAIHLIAEIVNQFDLVALVELRDRLGDLGRLMAVLGDYWKVVYCDFRSDDAGNRERIGFLYDSRSVRFTGLAAEANPQRHKDPATGAYVSDYPDWWRSPYMASFKAGSFDFILCAVHMQWGTAKNRTAEIRAFADWIATRQNDEAETEKDWFVMGDFNIESTAMMDELLKCGFGVPKGFVSSAAKKAKLGLATNVDCDQAYDQLLHSPSAANAVTGMGGVLDFYAGDHKPLFPDIADKKNFTFQMSDHLPLWIQIKTDLMEKWIANGGKVAKAGKPGKAGGG
ncbi:Endonuclease/Exonuclease/phosphatase family protein [Magnetospirillum sp. LM-5]|uniref:endonuclease/exonuclease/phosphatase family protein n=1 Tax=Magnetospirillum sp. LM-5 TaxID=2681466 RepID=UPI00137F3F31|nr:endonuclease/exonuclease/phosphatase family protein [Magnetospirillum sp. LM-5]CAA7615386.1 Endonuclease/Exonuclease/phosphatase family protein [Magnetospirillum sp. LM-5]